MQSTCEIDEAMPSSKSCPPVVESKFKLLQYSVGMSMNGCSSAFLASQRSHAECS